MPAGSAKFLPFSSFLAELMRGQRPERKHEQDAMSEAGGANTHLQVAGSRQSRYPKSRIAVPLHRRQMATTCGRCERSGCVRRINEPSGTRTQDPLLKRPFEAAA